MKSNLKHQRVILRGVTWMLTYSTWSGRVINLYRGRLEIHYGIGFRIMEPVNCSPRIFATAAEMAAFVRSVAPDMKGARVQRASGFPPAVEVGK